MAFTTVQEIEQHYVEAINKAGINFEAVIELKAEQKAVLADFRLAQVAERERKLWLREAVQEYPLARSFPQLILGETEDEVRNSAKQVHEQLTTTFQEHQRQEAVRKLYEQQLAASQNLPSEESNESTI
jgi:hypothetical protein